MFSTPRSGRLILIIAAIALTMIVAMTAFLLWQLRERELKHAEGETVSISHIVAEQTARSLQAVDLALDVALDRIAQAEKLGLTLGDYAVHTMLVSRIEGMPQLRSMFIVDATGKIVSSALSHPAPTVSVNDREYFTVLRDRPDLTRYVGFPVINRVDGKPTLFFSRSMRNSKGVFVGVVTASLDIAYLESLYDSVKMDAVGAIGLYMTDGTKVAEVLRDESLMATDRQLPETVRNAKADVPFIAVRSAGEDPSFFAYRRIGGFPMVLVVANRDRDALAGWRGTARMSVALAMVNIVLVIGAAALLLHRQRRELALAEAARESDERVRAMVDAAMDAIVTVDSDQRVVVFNPAAERMFGYSAGEICGSRLDRLLPERYRLGHRGNVALFSQGGISAHEKNSRMDIVGLRADGSEFPIESSVARIVLGGQTLFTAILRDISERRNAENEAHESNRQLRELASSLQEVREQERTAIARELHDELGQQLLRLRMDLSWLAGRLKDLSPVLQEKVAEMKHFVEGTVDAVRRVTKQLRPPLLDDLGLADAAKWQLDEFARRTGIEVTSTIDLQDAELDEHVAINVFRILQESLTNVARHSGAARVHVALMRADGQLALDVQDDGGGIAQRESPQLGHGLVGIRERTLLLGGQMEIFSAPGKGFTLSIRMALPEGQLAGETA